MPGLSEPDPVVHYVVKRCPQELPDVKKPCPDEAQPDLNPGAEWLDVWNARTAERKDASLCRLHVQVLVESILACPKESRTGG